MNPTPTDPSVRFPHSAIGKILADLGIADMDAVASITIQPGHVTVIGYERDEFDRIASVGGKPSSWSRVYPVDFEA